LSEKKYPSGLFQILRENLDYPAPERKTATMTPSSAFPASSGNPSLRTKMAVLRRPPKFNEHQMETGTPPSVPAD